MTESRPFNQVSLTKLIFSDIPEIVRYLKDLKDTFMEWDCKLELMTITWEIQQI